MTAPSLAPARPDGGDGGPRKRLRDKAEVAEDAMVPHEPLSRVMRRALKPNTHVERSAVRTVQVRVRVPAPSTPAARRRGVSACVRAAAGWWGFNVRVAQVMCACCVHYVCVRACAFARARVRASGRFVFRSW